MIHMAAWEEGGYLFNSSLQLPPASHTLDINLLPKLANLLKQDSSKCSLHRAVILGEYVRFYLFLHIMAIFLFLGKLKKGQVGVFVLLYCGIYKLHTKKLYCTGAVSHKFTKMRLQHRCFPVKLSKFLRTPFLQKTSGRLLLKNSYCSVF